MKISMFVCGGTLIYKSLELIYAGNQAVLVFPNQQVLSFVINNIHSA